MVQNNVTMLNAGLSKKLVAYFSASGVTRTAAETLAEAAGADLYEIRPEIPYSKSDLNWNNKASRSSVEMNDKSCRPVLSDCNAEIEMYDLIFLGFPIWLAYHNLIQCTQA